MKNFTQRKLFMIFLLTLLAGSNSLAQVGQEFWFVAPEVTSDHGDSPVVFRITAFDQDANVNIYLGTNQTTPIATLNVPAGTQQKYEANKENIENKPSNTINNKGIFVTSDQDISVYYEITHSNNPDKFTLKGENALGTEFYVPSQNDFDNHDYGDAENENPARERIDIVATENGTEITIIPSDDVIGHSAGETISITLNKGQSYSIWGTNTGESATHHLGGTYISSSNPIAVTISDDSIERISNPGHWDLIGDQLIPTDVIGTEYIAMNTTFGAGIKSDQKVYVLATEDNTFVNINDQPKVTLNKGELHSITLGDYNNNGDTDLGGAPAAYISSDKPIYVYQVTGVPPASKPDAPNGTELGSAILPSLTCTGSTSVSFTRNLNERFWVQLMTKKGNEGDFSISGTDEGGNNASVYLDKAVWHDVPGTGLNGDPAWVTAVVKMSAIDGLPGISTNNPYTITNSSLFHMSILDENGVSMSFGYFSAYSSLRIKGPKIFCETEGNITLETQEPMNSYTWYHALDEFQHEEVASGVPSIEVSEPGKYWVTSTSLADPQCELTDTVEILSVTPDFSIEGDTVVCPGAPLTFTASPTGTYDYRWPDGSTGNSYIIANGLIANEVMEISLTATYNITESQQCVKEETQSITARSVPEVDWSVTGQEICLGDTLKAVVISGEELIIEYQWSVDGALVPNHNEPYIVPTQSGSDYSLTVITEDNCDVDKTINLTVHALPDASIADAAVCPGENHTFSLSSGYSNYLWQGSSRENILGTSESLTLSSTDSVYVQVTDLNGCVNQDSAYFEVYNEHVFSFGTDTSVCKNNPIEIEIDDTFTNYQWTFNGTPISPAPPHIYSISNATDSDEGRYAITAIDMNGCDVEGFFDLDVQEMPALGIAREADICADDEANMIKIGVENPLYTNFEWVNTNDPGTILSNDNYLLIDDAGTYQLTATQDNGCFNTATTTVNSWSSPSFDIPDVTFCPNEEISLGQDTPQGWYSPQSAPDDTPRNHRWYTRNDNDELELYYEGVDLGDAQAGNPDPGVYFLEVHDAVCKFIDDVEISYHELTEIELEDDEFCDNESYTLEMPASLSSEVNTHYWSQEGTSNRGATNSNWTITEDSDYTLHIEDNNGCTNEETLTLSHLPAPKFVLGADDDKCLGDTLMVMTEPTFNRYEWNGDTSDGQTNVYTTTASGYDLNFSLQIWDENGCTATETASIDVFALPVVDLGEDQEECPGHEITLTIPSFSEIYWTTRQQDVTSVTVANGKHKVRVVDDNGCTAEDSMTFVWRPVPTIELGKDLFICPVEYPVQIEAPAGFSEYTWHNGEKSRFITADLMDTLNTVYVVDEFGCIGWDTKVVDILGYPEYSLGNDTTACDSDELFIDAGSERVYEYAGEQTITPFIDYLWNTGNQEQTQEITEPGDYWVEIFDGCFYLRDTIHVDYYPTPEITRLDTFYYAQVSIFAENGTQPYQFALDDEDRLQENNTFKEVENGEHTAYVEDDNGCVAYTIFTLNATYDIDVPNFFTPNNDGFNDTWQVEGLDRLPDSEISIFDRYGKLLRKFKASESISWDGEYQNKPVPSDDYWYVIHLEPIDKIIKGNVTIKR